LVIDIDSDSEEIEDWLKIDSLESEDSELRELFVMEIEMLCDDIEETEDRLDSDEREEKLLFVIDMLTLSEDAEEMEDWLDSDEREDRLLFETEKLTSEI